VSGQIVQIVPAAPGWNAVFRSSEGEPAPGSEVARGGALVPVACWALVEDDEGRRGVLPLTGGDDTAGLVIADRALAISPPGHRPQDWSAEERLRAVARASELREEDLGAFLRREGLRRADLERWRGALLEALDPKAQQQTKKRRSVQSKRVRELERELRRKDQALAETAALLALKKKAQAIWGDEDDDTR